MVYLSETRLINIDMVTHVVANLSKKPKQKMEKGQVEVKFFSGECVIGSINLADMDSFWSWCKLNMNQKQ